MTIRQAITNSVKGEYGNYCRLSRRIPADFVELVLTEEEPLQLFEAIWSNMEIDYRDRQMMMEENSLFLRLTMLYAVLVRENEILKAEQDIQTKMQQHIDIIRNQRGRIPAGHSPGKDPGVSAAKALHLL